MLAADAGYQKTTENRENVNRSMSCRWCRLTMKRSTDRVSIAVWCKEKNTTESVMQDATSEWKQICMYANLSGEHLARQA